MSIAKVVEISASSKKGFDNAVERGIARASKTIEGIEGAWVNEMKVKVENGKITEYRVNLELGFLLKD